MSEKVIRDPVHDVVAFRLDRPVDALLFRLLNAAEFQRLRRIRQLGMAHLAYPGADHSRYSHSLGVMETARRILDRLARSMTLDEQSVTVCLAAALLHDLGHGPFSHVFERVSGIHHERLTQRVVLDPDSHVHRELFLFDKTFPEKVVDFMRCRPKRTFYCDVISSQLDADRFDYLLRDNLMTGSRYGDFDLGWLLQALTVDTTSDRLAVTWKGISAVEAYLQARYHMYRNVYFHKVVRSAEGMLKLALRRAKRLAVQGRLDWPPPSDEAFKALTGQRLTMAEFTRLDDVSLLHCFKRWADSDDATLAGLCRGLLYRRVFKTIDLSHVDDPQRVSELYERAQHTVRAAGGDADYELFLDEPADTPYTIDTGDDGSFGKEILVQTPTGGTRPFASASPMTSALNRQLMFHRIHVAEPWREAVWKVVGG